MENSNRGCAQMVIGVVVLVFAAAAWLGAGINKTATGVLEPALALSGAVVLIVGVVRRVRWVRGED